MYRVYKNFLHSFPGDFKRLVSRTLKKFLCPSRGMNREPFDLEASTLPRRYNQIVFR